MAGGRRTNDWAITLSRRVPVDLRVSTGAGRASLDLSGPRGDVDVRAGAGEVTVVFGEGEAAVEELELQAGAGRFEATGLGSKHARAWASSSSTSPGRRGEPADAAGFHPAG